MITYTPAERAGTVEEELTCCGEPMVHNSFTGEYECADAYFRLADEGFDEIALALVTAEEVGPALESMLTHWRESRIPDGRVDA
jgi:hypothetical protein